VFDFQLDGLQLLVQNQSTGGDSWLWNFGDGQTSSLQNPPPHVYADTGIYIVTLTVTNQCGVSIVQEEVEITQMSSAVTDPAMGARVVIRPNPNSGTFTLDWSFGEGNQAQVRLYSAAGALLHQWFLNGPSRVLQATELPDGVYPLQVASGGKSVWKKLVINRGQ
jgi:PKD repeat protein